MVTWFEFHHITAGHILTTKKSEVGSIEEAKERFREACLALDDLSPDDGLIFPCEDTLMVRISKKLIDECVISLQVNF